jgi:glycosyltransferase involved in cell wall biosynthesis
MGDGGTQRQKSLLSRELCKKYDLTIALFDNIQLHKFYGNVIDLKAPSSKNPFIILKNSIRRIFLLRKQFINNNYDVVISSSIVSNSFSLFVKFAFGIKIMLILTFNNANKLKSDDMGILGYFVTFINKLLSGYADCIVPVAKALGDELTSEGYPSHKITSIYNGIDLDDIMRLSNKKIEKEYIQYLNKDCFKIISVGRLTAQKDYSTLIKAFGYVREKIQAKLFIFGDGDLKEGLLNEIQTLNLKNDVHLFGWVKNPYKFLRHSNLFVLSSQWEGFPNVLLEALGCGLPIISTDCKTGPNEIITSGKNGFLVPVGDYEKLSEIIIMLATDKKLYHRIAIEGRKRSRDFDIRKVALEWQKVIENVADM